MCICVTVYIMRDLFLMYWDQSICITLIRLQWKHVDADKHYQSILTSVERLSQLLIWQNTELYFSPLQSRADGRKWILCQNWVVSFSCCLPFAQRDKIPFCQISVFSFSFKRLQAILEPQKGLDIFNKIIERSPRASKSLQDRNYCPVTDWPSLIIPRDIREMPVHLKTPVVKNMHCILCRTAESFNKLVFFGFLVLFFAQRNRAEKYETISETKYWN